MRSPRIEYQLKKPSRRLLLLMARSKLDPILLEIASLMADFQGSHRLYSAVCQFLSALSIHSYPLFFLPILFALAFRVIPPHWFLLDSVYFGTHESTGAQVALKIMDKARVARPPIAVQAQRELSALELIDSPHVLKVHRVDWHCVHDGMDAVAVVIELASGGELFDFVKMTGHFDEPIACSYFAQLMAGVSACHAAGVAHRDLKTENILMSADFVLKIADFGFAVPALRPLSTVCGTKGYQPPEVLSGHAYDGRVADIWSCGVILFSMLAGYPPFDLEKGPLLTDWYFDKLKTCRHFLFWQAHCRTSYFSQDAKDLINRMLEPNPLRRIGVDEILAHPWVCGCPILSPQALSVEMRHRKSAIDAERRSERLRYSAKHGSDLADTRYRHLDQAGEPFPPPPPLPHPHVGGLCDFCTAVAPAEALAAMTLALQSHDSVADVQVFAREHRLVLRTRTETGPLECSVCIFSETNQSAPVEHAVSLVRVTRLAGDPFAFRARYAVLERELTFSERELPYPELSDADISDGLAL